MDSLTDGLRHDPTVRRKAQRSSGEKGVRVFIPKADLIAAGFDPDDPAPLEYRTWGQRRGSVLVRLYRSG